MKEIVRDLAVKRCIEAVYTGGIVEWSADGKTLYSTCSNVVKAINLDDNLSSYNIGDEEEELRITCICLDSQRGRLFVAYNNQMVREYVLPGSEDEKATVARMWKTLHDGPILLMKCNSDGSVLATGSTDHNVKIWDLKKQHCTHTLKGPAVVSALSFTSDSTAVVGYIEGQVKMFDLDKASAESLVKEWNNHSSHVTSLVSLLDSQRVIVFSRDQTAAVIDTETLETVKVLPLFEPVESAVAVHNGNIITVGEEGVVKEWKIETAKLVRKRAVTAGRLDSVIYNPVRDQLLTISAEECIYLLSFTDKTLPVMRNIVGFHDEVYSTCLFGEKESHLAVASNSREIRVYDTQTWDCQLVEGHTESVLSVVVAPWDRNLIASCSKDNSIILWRRIDKSEKGSMSTSRVVPVGRATGHTHSVNAICFSNSAKRPFLLSVSTDSTLKLWSLIGIELKPTSTIGEPELESLRKLECSSTIVAHSKDANCVDVAQSDTLCLTGGMDKLVKLWHIDVNKMQLGIAGNLTGHRRGVGDARFSHNSQRVVSCSGDLTIKVWDLQNKSCLQTLSGHNSAVFKVTFVNHGTQLVSADSSGIMKIWTLATSECEKSIEAHTDKIWCLTVSQSEGEYVTAGSDGRIVMWKDVSEERRAEEDEKRRKKIEEEQTLSNLLEQDRYQDALEYALGLARPYCALKVIDQLLDRGELSPALARLDLQKVQTLLDFGTQWNTNSRTSQASQQVLNALLMIYPPEELLKLPNINNVVLSYIPYTKRHMERLNKARQDVTLLNFTWNQMRLN